MTALRSEWSGSRRDLRAERDQGARLVHAFLLYTPVLWLLGLIVPLSVAMIGRLAIKRWPTDGWTNLLFAGWALTAAAQAVATIYNWGLTDEPVSFLLGKLVGFPILGWLMLGLCVAVGRSWNLAQAAVVRGTTILALSILVFGCAGIAGAFVTKWPYCFIYTPLYPLLGQGPTASFYATASLWHPEEGSFGLPRLVLFYPWATCLGIAGLSIVFISLCETSARWRAIGLAGGLFAIAFSFSRAAIAILPVAIVCYLVLRIRHRTAAALLVLVCLTAAVIVTLGLDPLAAVNDLMASLRDSRAGSSQARALIYERSYEAFLDAPVLGNGWVGDSIIKQEALPIGSHSTLYGVLYMGGLTTFMCLCGATLALLASTVVAALRDRSREAAAAAAITLAFALFGYGEGVYNLVLPCCFAFLFIGGALSWPPIADRSRA